MKTLYTILFFLCFSFMGKSQELMVKELISSIKTSYQQSTIETFYISNYSNINKSIRVKLNNFSFQGGTTLELCYSGECYSDNNLLIINIPANTVSKDIKIILTGGLSNYKNDVYIEFIDLDVDRIIKKEINIEVSDLKMADVFFSKENISVSSFYPNPAVKYASMEYSLANGEENAKIILQNVLGSIITEIILDPRENKFNLSTEELKPGVYFYTLSINDEGLATRKLIVKK